MYHTRRAVPTLVLAAALVCGTAACGASASSAGAKAAKAASKPTAGSGPLADLTADQIAAKASADIKAVTSVQLTGKVQSSGLSLTFDLTLEHNKGCQGSFAETKGSFKIIYLGKKVWIRPSRRFYKSLGGINSATLSLLAGKWLEVKANGSSFKSLTSMCKLNKLLTGFASPKGLVKGSTVTVNGQRAVKIEDTGDSAYMYVSDTATPELMRLVNPGSSGGDLDFTTQATPVTITAPPASKVLSGSKYGF